MPQDLCLIHHVYYPILEKVKLEEWRVILKQMVAETKISYKLAKNLEWGGKSRQLREYWKGSQGWVNEMIPKTSWFKIVWHQNKYRNSKYWVAGSSRDLPYVFFSLFLQCLQWIASPKRECLVNENVFNYTRIT